MLKKIPIDELKVGMCLVDCGLSFIDHPYLYTGSMVIRSERQIDKLRSEGYLEFFVDTERGFVARFREQAKRQKRLIKESSAEPFEEEQDHDTPLDAELAMSRRLYARAMHFTGQTLKAARGRENPACDEALELVSALIMSLDRNPHALTGMTSIRRRESYELTHCVNVAVISLLFGRHLGLGIIDLQHLGAAALLHDLGKARISRAVISKTGRLDPEEFAAVKLHPVYGCQLLRAGSGLPEPVLRAVLDHHEKHDGSGYPRSLSGEDISPLARIITLADVYDALTSERGYRRTLMPNQAMAVIYEMRDSAFYPEYAERFIQCLGMFPVGAFVRLSDGSYGVVVDQNTRKPLRPKVRVVLDQRMRHVAPFTVDLENPEISGHDALAISECLDHRNYAMDLNYHLA